MHSDFSLNTSLLHRIQPEYGDEQADAGRDCRTRLTRPNSQARTNADREIFLFPVQLTTSRKIGNLTRLTHTLAIYDDNTSGKKWQEGRLKEKSQIIQHKRDPWVRGMSTLTTRDDGTASGVKGQGNVNFPASSNDEQDWQPRRLMLTLLLLLYVMSKSGNIPHCHVQCEIHSSFSSNQNYIIYF